MEEYDKRVTAMYNDCWKLYRDYTKSHDMRQFNEAKDAVKDKDERLDDGSTDIDSLDAFEYTIERDMRDLIEEVENV